MRAVPSGLSFEMKAESPPYIRLEGSGSGREVSGGGLAGYIGASERVYRDGVTLIKTVTSKVRGINQNWINDQRPRRVIVTESKSDPALTLRNITRSDSMSHTIRILVSNRFAPPYVSVRGM